MNRRRSSTAARALDTLRRHAGALALAFALTGLAGCGGASTLPHRAGIEEIRRRADERPLDPEAQALWAEAEMLMSDGDVEAAARAIARAQQLLPDSPRIAYLDAALRQQHGELDAAFTGMLRTLQLAARSTDPLAPAIAEVAVAFVAEFDDAVPSYGSRLREVIEPLHREPGAIGPQARHAIGVMLTELAYRRGEIATVQALRESQGCPSEWRVAGPFGPRQLLDFDRALPPDSPGALADAYDLGPGRETRPTRTLEPRGCTLHLGGGPVAGPGTTYAEATLSVPQAGEYLLRVESPNAIEVRLDDARVARIDRRATPGPRVTFHPVTLAAGSHRVTVKTSTRHANPLLVVSLLRADGRAASEGPSTTPFVDASPATDRPLEAALHAARAMTRADYATARETLAPFVADAGATSTMLIMGSIVALSDSLTGQQVAADTGRRLLMQAAARDEQAWYPVLQLANLESDDLTKQRMLRDAMPRWPELLLFPLTLFDALEARGWSAEADRVIAEARRMVPDACRPKRAALNSALRRGRSAEAGALAEELVACDARSDARMLHAVRQRRWADAHAEVRRIADLEPASSRFQTADAELTLARSRGEEENVERLLAELGELAPRSEAVVLMQVDRRLANGDARGAQTLLDEALTREPTALASLHRIARAQFGQSPLESYRQDGAAVIRAFEASGRTYDGPKVLVLDYTVVHVFDDGSQLSLTHNIVRLQSEEAVDQEGEFGVPEGAQLLTLRTVKADGRRLEPDEIQGKDTISLPNLAVGDYVEFEFLRAEPAPAGFPRGVVGDRFYFQSFEVPFDRSELTVSLPAAMADVVIDTRGDAPPLEESRDGDRRMLRWRVQESRPRTPEPGSVSAREYLPSVLWGYRATWDAYVETVRDVLADRDLRDPAHVRLVREIAGDGTPEQRARRIYHWVIANIDDASDPFGQAATMVHGRTGHRSRVLVYLLRIAGIEADLALARSFAGDQTPSELADDETYSFFAVRMQGSTGPIWLWPGARGTPFGFLPLEPAIRGQEALVLNAAAERTRVSDPAVESDLTNIDVDVHLDGSGGARVEVTETFVGASAVAWRSQLEGVPTAHLEEAFERQYVARIAGGARMTELTITGRTDPDMPLELHYVFEVARLGRLTDAAHVVPQLYPVALANSYASLAQRTTTQVLASGARDVTMRIHLPDGAVAPALPPERTLEGPAGMRASWRATAEGRVVTIARSVRLPRARIEPSDYPAFARFARTYDQAENFELAVGM